MYASLVTEYTTYTHMAVCSPACRVTVKTLYRWNHGGKVHLKKKESHNGALCDLKKRNYQKACMKNRQLVSLHYKLVVFHDICVLCSNPQNFDTSPFDRYNMQTVCSAMLNCPQTNSLTAPTASSYNRLLLL